MIEALHDLEVVDLRLFMVYGPGQHPPKVVPAVAMSLLRGEPAKLTSGRRPYDWVYIDDVVDAFVAAAADRPGVADETIDVGSGVLLTVREVVEQIVEVIGSDVEPAVGALPDRPLDEMARRADVERTRELLGWRSRTTLRDGLEATIAWCRRKLEGEAKMAET